MIGTASTHAAARSDSPSAVRTVTAPASWVTATTGRSSSAGQARSAAIASVSAFVPSAKTSARSEKSANAVPVSATRPSSAETGVTSMPAPAISPHHPYTKSRVARPGASRSSHSPTLTSSLLSGVQARPAALIATITRSRSPPCSGGTGNPDRSAPPVYQRADSNDGAGATRTP